ncbi:MAG: Na+/H+ antiporter subunit E [Pseudomonadota bacterium]|nr:Na+/H+ antiporter subunit E [Pseudomonadota bacterium]
MRARKLIAPTHFAHALLWRGAWFSALWWVLTLGRADSWRVGAVSVALALAASLILLPPTGKRLSLRGLAGYLAFFLAQSVRGGVQVAGMALSPRFDLRPGVLEITLRLPDGAGRVVLANTLNLLARHPERGPGGGASAPACAGYAPPHRRRGARRRATCGADVRPAAGGVGWAKRSVPNNPSPCWARCALPNLRLLATG